MKRGWIAVLVCACSASEAPEIERVRDAIVQSDRAVLRGELAATQRPSALYHADDVVVGKGGLFVGKKPAATAAFAGISPSDHSIVILADTTPATTTAVLRAVAELGWTRIRLATVRDERIEPICIANLAARGKAKPTLSILVGADRIWTARVEPNDTFETAEMRMLAAWLIDVPVDHASVVEMAAAPGVSTERFLAALHETCSRFSHVAVVGPDELTALLRR